MASGSGAAAGHAQQKERDDAIAKLIAKSRAGWRQQPAAGGQLQVFLFGRSAFFQAEGGMVVCVTPKAWRERHEYDDRRRRDSHDSNGHLSRERPGGRDG